MSRDPAGDPLERPKAGTVRNALTSEARDRQRRSRWFRRSLFWLALGCGSWILWLVIGDSKRSPLDPNLLIYCIGAGFWIAFLYGLLAASSFLLTGSRTEDLMLHEDVFQLSVLVATPRQVRIRGKALIAPIVIMLITAVAALCLWRPDARVRRALATQGRETQGTVTRLVWSRGSRVGFHDTEYPGFHHYAFQYTAGGRAFSGLSGRFEENELPAPGSKVPVTYLPENPATALPMAKSRIPAGWLAMDWRVLGVAAASAFGLGSLLVQVALAVRREYRLARYGEAAVGTVTDLTDPAPREGRLFGMRAGKASAPEPPRLTYQFRSLEGHDIGGETRKVSSEHKKGSQLTILYDPLNPARNIPLASFSYVKIQRPL